MIPRAVVDMPGGVWPPVPSPRGAILSAFVKELELSQFRSPQELADVQELQIAALLRHAHRTCASYSDRLSRAGYRDGDSVGSSSWQRIEPLTRAELQKDADGLTSDAIPPAHGKTFEEATSGSSGTPVTVLRTGLTGLVSEAFTVYEHLLHARDLMGKHAFLKFFEDPQFASGADGVRQKSWGPPVNRLYQSGPSIAMSVETSVAQQASFLM